MSHVFHLPAPPAVRAALHRDDIEDRWLICDASEIADLAEKHVPEKYRKLGGGWAGNMPWPRLIEAERLGDVSSVNRSDALMAEMAEYMPESMHRAYLDDVAGAVPNIPAFIAGHPLTMRRRVTRASEYAPLAIAFDPTCSAVISPEQIRRRGVCVLALVRALASRRPVELWVCGGLDVDCKHGAWIACRVETAPLDLARAAHYLTHPGHVRAITYGLLTGVHNAGPSWPYDNVRVSISHFKAIVSQALPHASDVLALPGLTHTDELINNPRAWLERTIQELTA